MVSVATRLIVKLVCVESTVMVSVLVVYPSLDTVTLTSPSSIPVKEQPPAEPVVLVVEPITTDALCIGSVPSFIVNEISLV